MRVTVSICDLCGGDEGKFRLAVARYWDGDGIERDTCRRHLVDVKSAGLDYEEFAKLGDPDPKELI